MAVNGCQWLSMAVNGCQWLSTLSGRSMEQVVVLSPLPTAQLVRIPAPQAWLPQRTLSVSMVSASELRVCLQSQYGPSARTSSSSTGLRPVPPVRTDLVRIKYSPRGLRKVVVITGSRRAASCGGHPTVPGTLRIGGGNVGTAGGSAVSASRRASCCVVSF